MSFFVILFLIFGIAYAAYLPNMQRESEWMVKIKQPADVLPGWVCGLAWAGIYLLMTVAVWLVWEAEVGQDLVPALGIFVLQFFVNILWGPVIVRQQSLKLATFYLYVLFGLVIWNMRAFWEISETAGQLFIPYVIWMIYSLYIQIVTWRQNS